MSELEDPPRNMAASRGPSPGEDVKSAAHDQQTRQSVDGSPTELELCHYSLTAFPDLTAVSASLRKLVILAQDIDTIGDLSTCAQLESLWICETNVRDVAPLAGCMGLVELYLYANQIDSIAALGGLSRLKRLWVNDNAISDISCLGGCSELEELCAVNNAILDVGPGIAMNTQLQNINLAGNSIYLIDVLETLGQLPNLAMLILDHSFYGSNPICEIPHYEIAVLCHCTHLSKLNEKLITSSMISQAQTIQRKKRRFYEIAWQSAVSEYLATVLAQRDLVARSMSPLSYALGYLDWAETMGITMDQRALGLHSDLVARLKNNHGNTTRTFRSLILEQCKLRLMCTYLGGVEFVPTDSASVAALGVPLERFLGGSEECEALAIEFSFDAPDDGVLLVTPVHEDLFLVSRGRLPIALFHGAGSMTPALQQDDCAESTIPHFVSKDYSDYRSESRQRLESALDDAAKTSATQIDLSHMGISSLPSLILPHVTQARLTFNSLYDLKQIFSVFPNVTRLDVAYNQITRLPDSYPPTLAFLDASGNRFGAECYDTLLQWIHSIDEVVYDDYLLEEPLRLPKNYFLFPPASTVRPALNQGPSGNQQPHQQILASSILDSVHLSLGLKHVKHLSLRNCNLTSIEQLSRMHHLEHVYLAGNLLASLAPLVHLPSLHVVDVACNRVSEVITLSNMATTSSSHGGEAASTANSSSAHSRVFPRLTHLNVCGNSIKSLDFIRKLGKLQELHIAHNQIMDAGQVNSLQGAHHLVVLDMRGNPFAASLLNYRATVIYTSPALQVLDGAPVSDDEVAGAKQLLVGCLTRTKLVERLDAASVRSLTCLDMRACGLVRIECFTAGEFPHLAFVNLDGNQLSDISNLVHLQALRCLSVSGNKLESLPDPAKILPPGRGGAAGKVGGMARSCSPDRDGGPLGLLWPSLAELYLDHNQFQRVSDLFPESIALELRILSLRANKLVKLDGLERVRTMQKLYVDGNQVRSIDVDVAGGMRSLKELSLNDNRIKSILFIKHMPKIKYLYADRNRVTELVDVGSQTLLTVSMVGNPISRVAAYRAVIQQIMPAVTRIDGVIVTEDEREAARVAVQLAPDSTQWQATAIPSQQPSKQALRFSNVTLDGSELGSGSSLQHKPVISVKTLTLGGNGVIGNGR